jgi:hypothetical protein
VFVPDLSVATELGTTYSIEWVPAPERDATTTSTRKHLAEITRSRKLEGMWWGDDGAFFVASFARTTDGSAAQHDGQVWFIDPEAQTIELKLHFAYTPADQDNDPDGPDNITVSAFGGLTIADDGDGMNHLLGSREKARCSSSPGTTTRRTRSSRTRTSPTTRRSCSRTSSRRASCTRSAGRSASSAEAAGVSARGRAALCG